MSKEEHNELIILHYDIDKHRLPYAQFYSSAHNVRKIIETFNVHLFNKTLKYELYVAAPRKGGFVEFLLPLISGGVVSYLLSEPGLHFIKELTGVDLKDSSGKFAHVLKAYIKDEKTTSQSLQEVGKDSNLLEFLSQLIALSVKNFLEKKPDELKKIGVDPQAYRDAYEAKNKIFEDCVNNSEIQAIEFDLSYTFSIKRRNFPEYISALPEITDKEIDEETSWKVGVEDLIVYSPVWKREGSGKPRLWKADTKDYQDISFEIEDELFWHKVNQKEITPSIRDNIKVQWIYPDKYEKPSHVQVLKVITYNGQPISSAYTAKELEKRFHQFRQIEKDHPDLFD